MNSFKCLLQHQTFAFFRGTLRNSVLYTEKKCLTLCCTQSPFSTMSHSIWSGQQPLSRHIKIEISTCWCRILVSRIKNGDIIVHHSWLTDRKMGTKTDKIVSHHHSYQHSSTSCCKLKYLLDFHSNQCFFYQTNATLILTETDWLSEG